MSTKYHSIRSSAPFPCLSFIASVCPDIWRSLTLNSRATRRLSKRKENVGKVEHGSRALFFFPFSSFVNFNVQRQVFKLQNIFWTRLSIQFSSSERNLVAHLSATDGRFLVKLVVKQEDRGIEGERRKESERLRKAETGRDIRLA